MAPTRKQGTAKSDDGKVEAPPSPQSIRAHASLAMKLSEMLGGMAHELVGGQATAERQAEICRVVGDAASAITGWSVERIRRMTLVKAVALAVHFDAHDEVAIQAVRTAGGWAFVEAPPDEVIIAAVEAWRRAGAQREDSKAPTAWPALADLVRQSGLGRVEANSLRVDWTNWKKLVSGGV